MARTYSKTLNVGRGYRPGGDLRFIIYGNELAKDLAPFEAAMWRKFPKSAGIPITMGGATLMKRFVRQRMRPPQYPILPSGKTYWGKPYTPSGGYVWYSGTLRRALHARLASQKGSLTVSAMLPDKKKGRQPRWARWGPPKNAYYYARWVEFGQVPDQPRRPFMQQGFNKGKRTVANWMMAQTWFYIRGFARIGRAKRLARSRWR